MCSMSGDNRTVIHNITPAEGGGWPNGLTIDYDFRRLYWIDARWVGLTHYYTKRHFDVFKIYSCGKHCEKRRNCLLQAISPFLTMFSIVYSAYFPF